ncbi:sigma-70 family RNA polymerase sigma factor [Leptolyngbya sp. AN02str]|uniref:sigma-70 family RNA polymerase sigma factor n=1 Tax=Leptolyngbya sp. AN02str TaxID=3423363 RepID=UPI003D311364
MFEDPLPGAHPSAGQPSNPPCDRLPDMALLLAPNVRAAINRLARRKTYGTEISWEDAAQTAYLRILQQFRNGRFARNHANYNVQGWVMVVARNAILDLLKEARRKRALSLDTVIAESNETYLDQQRYPVDVAMQLEHRDFAIAAIHIIAKLDQQHPERHYLKIVHGRFYQNKSQAQLAQELNLKQPTISRRLAQLPQVVRPHLDVEFG